MSKASAAAAIVGGVLLALVGAVGTVSLIVAAIFGVYSAGIALWVVLPLVFVAGVVATIWGIAVLIREAGDFAGDSIQGLSDIKRADDLKDLRRMYKKLS